MEDEVTCSVSADATLSAWIRRAVDGLPYEMVVVRPTADFDLGMRTRRELFLQLSKDLPRSRVSVRGRRAVHPVDVLSHCRYPRMCTQSVFAVPVEWFLRAGVLLSEERDAGPVVVEVDDDGHVSAHKRLGMRPLERPYAAPVQLVDVTVHSCDARVTVVRLAGVEDFHDVSSQ